MQRVEGRCSVLLLLDLTLAFNTFGRSTEVLGRYFGLRFKMIVLVLAE